MPSDRRYLPGTATPPLSATRRATRLADSFAAEPELIRACIEDVAQAPPDVARTVLEAARRALAQCPKYADLHYHAAQAAVTAGDLATAAELLNDALHINATYRDALVLAGEVALRLERWTEADRYLTCALQAGADYPDVHVLFAELWRRQGRLQRAAESYRRALRQNPRLSAAQAGLAALAGI